MTKRILEILLCAVMLWSMLVPTAFASAEPSEEPAPVGEESVEAVPEEALSANTEEMEAEPQPGPEEPAEEAPVEEAPVEEAPAEEAPAEEAPAEEAPVEEAPVEEAPVEEAPVAKIPGGEDWWDPEDPLYPEMTEKLALDGAAAASLWSSIPTFSDFNPREREKETVHPGIDVSSWQGKIDWEKVAADGVEFVFIRAAYRGTTLGALGEDVRYKTYIEGAKAAGLQVGVYIYSQAITVEEGVQEAKFLLERIEGYDIDLPVVIDYEYANWNGRLYKAKLTDRQRTDICLAFCETVEAAGYESMVYANASMLGDDMYAEELPRVWLAHYTEETGYKGEYEYWQCSDKGTINGIGGRVDLDFWFKPAENDEATGGDTGTDDKTPGGDTEAPEGGPFKDVKEKDWFYASVMEAYEAGIVNGLSETSFGPNAVARRGQVVTMLHRLMDEPAAETDAHFTDLTEAYYKNAVSWAAEQGIVKGVSETEFGPNGLITRQDLVTLLYRLEESPAATGDLDGYTDGADVRDYARSAMVWAVEQGILTGYEDDTLKPQKSATRAEVCAILMRYMALETGA